MSSAADLERHRDEELETALAAHERRKAAARERAAEDDTLPADWLVDEVERLTEQYRDRVAAINLEHEQRLDYLAHAAGRNDGGQQ